MVNVREFIKHGLSIRVRIGKQFDPHNQKRTTWCEDIERKKKEKKK